MKKSLNTAGNVYTILLGGVALAGALSYMMYQTMAGPVASMTRITKTAAAQAQMNALSRAIILDAVNQSTTNSGDCDSDGSVEPREWAIPSSAGQKPTNGGVLPASLAPSLVDPWGTTYGYCVWDVGTFNATVGDVVDHGCGVAASEKRLHGSPTPTAGNSVTQTVFALISAGSDRKFDTTCNAYVDGTTDLITMTAGKDDISMRFTYKEADVIAGALWTLKSGTPTTATIAKDLDVTGASVSALALVTATPATNTTTNIGVGTVKAGGGLALGDQNKITAAACGVSTAGLLRYNGGSGAAITVNKALTTQTIPRGTTTSASASFSSLPANHDTILVSIVGRAIGGAFSVSSVTDNKGNTYNLVQSKTVGGSNLGVYLYASYNIPAPAGTFTITVNYTGGTSRAVNWGAMAVSGLAQTADNHDVTGQNLGLSGAAITSAQTVQTSAGTTQANNFAIAVHGYDDATGDINVNYAPQSGWSQIFVNHDAFDYSGFSTVYSIVPATATTVGHTWTFTASHTHAVAGNTIAGIIATFKGASATSGTAHLDYCDGTTWQTAQGTGGTTSPITDIDSLYDGDTDYATLFHVGMGEAALSAATSGTTNTAIGQQALSSLTTGVRNTAAGYYAGYGLTTSGYSPGVSAGNTWIGANINGTSAAGSKGATGLGASAVTTSSGDANTGLGYKALSIVGSGRYNTAFGSESSSLQAAHDASTAFGYQALKNNIADNNSAFGYQALLANTTGTQNSAFGAFALAANVSDSGNTAFGYQALTVSNLGATTTGHTAFGYQTLAANSTGMHNTAAGYRALATNTSGGDNTAAGSEALTASTTGSNNTAAGYRALYRNTTGENNTAAGYGALMSATASSDNTALGMWSMSSTAGNIRNSSISVIQNVGPSAGEALSTLTLSFDQTPSAGNTMIVTTNFSHSAATAGITSITDNNGGTFTLASQRVQANAHAGTGTAGSAIYYRSNISAPTTLPYIVTVQYAAALDLVTASAEEVSGLAAASAVDVTKDNFSYYSATASTGETPTLYPITSSTSTAQANEYAVATLLGGNGGVYVDFNAANGWNGTRYFDQFCCGDGATSASYYRILGASGFLFAADNSSWNLLGNETSLAAALATFKGASAVAGTVTHPTGNTATGYLAMGNNQGSYNTALGARSLFNNQGDGNTAIGNGELFSNTVGNYNTFTGVTSYPILFDTNTSGSRNTKAGLDTLTNNQSSHDLTALGFSVLTANTSGQRNTAMGSLSLHANTSGTENTALGYFNFGAMETSTTASRNTTIVGLVRLTTGHENTDINNISGLISNLTTGLGNTSIGNGTVNRTGDYNTSLSPVGAMGSTGGSYNVTFGHNAMNCSETFSGRVFMGRDSCNGDLGMGSTGIGLNTGSGNETVSNITAVGNQAASDYISGAANNTAIGYQASTGSENAVISNSTALGYDAWHSGYGSGTTAAGTGSMPGTNIGGTGGNNTALGMGAGPDSTTGSNLGNITVIGYVAGTTGFSGVSTSNWFYLGNSNITSFSANVAYTSTSDRRLKYDIQDSDLGLNFILKLKPVSYRKKNGNERLDYGFIAQDVASLLPKKDTNLVQVGPLWALNLEELIAPLIRGIQERQESLNRRQADIEDLRRQIDRLEKLLVKD